MPIETNTEVYCDSCGRGMCGEDITCPKCVSELDYQIEGLEEKIKELESYIYDLEKKIEKSEADCCPEWVDCGDK